MANRLLKQKPCMYAGYYYSIKKSVATNEVVLTQRHHSTTSIKKAKLKIIDTSQEDVQIDGFAETLTYIKDSRILYNCLVNSHKLGSSHSYKSSILSRIEKDKRIKAFKSSVPLIIERLNICDTDSENTETEVKQCVSEGQHHQFPFAKFENLNIKDEPGTKEQNDMLFTDLGYASIKEDVGIRLKAYNEKKIKSFPQTSKSADEELEVRIYEDTLLSDLIQENNEGHFDFHGTPNPNVLQSSVPCGGCGVFLHCQDEGLPGYVPSEIFCNKNNTELRSLLCQRCFFLKRHNTALNVRISPDVYEKALEPISKSLSLVIVVLDLMDVPCCVWPGLFNLIGTRRPVVIVGNKVDLIPLDNHDYMNSIKTSLIECIKGTNLWKTNIRHVCLVSAKTGFGVESLISKIQVSWGVKGDIYILGCTNAGKSSLFNALLGSDMCKIAASSLIRRATSSPWPGTTLNLLKFPLLRPSGKRLFDRMHRIRMEAKKKIEDNVKMMPVKTTHPTMLTSHIGKTFQSFLGNESADPFCINAYRIPKDSPPLMGINEKEKDYAESKWCFDTPGTVQPDQFLGLLTHEELLDVLPKTSITPRIFSMRSSQSLFIGGLVRLDVLYCPSNIRVTVCASMNLPITIVGTSMASEIYRTYLGSRLFQAPRGNEARLCKWPSLMPTNIRLMGIGKGSVADVVLSSAGFVSISAKTKSEIDLRGWTPGGRGVYVREPSMLPCAYNLKGKRQRTSQMYYSRVVSLDED